MVRGVSNSMAVRKSTMLSTTYVLFGVGVPPPVTMEAKPKGFLSGRVGADASRGRALSLLPTAPVKGRRSAAAVQSILAVVSVKTLG